MNSSHHLMKKIGERSGQTGIFHGLTISELRIISQNTCSGTPCEKQRCRKDRKDDSTQIEHVPKTSEQRRLKDGLAKPIISIDTLCHVLMCRISYGYMLPEGEQMSVPQRPLAYETTNVSVGNDDPVCSCAVLLDVM